MFYEKARGWRLTVTVHRNRPGVEMHDLTYGKTDPSVTRDLLSEPGEVAYEAGRRAFNLAADQHPDRVALPRDEAEVAFAIRFAAEFGMTVVPQATGHGAAALGALENTLLLRTDRMRAVEINPTELRARVQSGARWEDVVPAASDLGLSALHGSSPDVGIVGYTLGGGLSWYARRYGLAANHVTSIEMMTADGELRRIDDTSDPDLFWALRGGGGGFGVVTSIEFELLPAAAVFAGALFFPWERSDEVLHAWNDWTPGVPDELASVGRILRFPPLPQIPEALRGKAFAIVEVVYLGSEAEGAELIAPLRRLGPAMDTFAAVPPAGISGLHMEPRDPVPYASDHQLIHHLPRRAIDDLVGLVGPNSGSPLLGFELRHLGGAVARETSGHGALGSVPGTYGTFGVGLAPDAKAISALGERLAMVRGLLEPYDAGYPLSNFTAQGAQPTRFFDATTAARLERIKRRVDPHGVFSPRPSA
jgi:hypothetical protein